jgi:hypothetical protein
MQQNFMIKEGKKNTSFYCLIGLSFFVTLSLQAQSHVATPIMLLLMLTLLLDWTLRFRWMFSFAVFVDVDKEEIILNHALFYKKKKISLNDIKEIDTLNGNIILFGSTPLSKWQRIVSKTSDCYTVRFTTIDAAERRQLMELLYTLKNKT